MDDSSEPSKSDIYHHVQGLERLVVVQYSNVDVLRANPLHMIRVRVRVRVWVGRWVGYQSGMDEMKCLG